MMNMPFKVGQEVRLNTPLRQNFIPVGTPGIVKELTERAGATLALVRFVLRRDPIPVPLEIATAYREIGLVPPKSLTDITVWVGEGAIERLYNHPEGYNIRLANISDACLGDISIALAPIRDWLYNTVQSEDAILSHHGIYPKLHDQSAIARMQIAPVAYEQRPVVSFDTAWYDTPTSGALRHVLSEQDVNALRDAITDAGLFIYDQWGGAGATTLSIALLDRAHIGLQRAVRNGHDFTRQHGLTTNRDEWVRRAKLLTKPEGWV